MADAVLSPAPVPTHPDFIDTVFASRAVVVAIRIALVFAALFVALSVIALITQRRWLTRVGPVEVSEELPRLVAENQRLKDELKTSDQVIEDLKGEVACSHQVIDKEPSRWTT
jgi:uncharacterized protein YlxW (UPF0749 family)